MTDDDLGAVERELLAAVDAGGGDDPQLVAALAVAATWVPAAASVVGLGALPDGAPCIVAHTDRPDALPTEVNGVPVVAVTDDQPRPRT